MPEPIIALDSAELQPRPAEYLPASPTSRRFDRRLARLSQRLGLKRLGCSVIAVPAGAAAFPFHNHRANDELFYIVAGRGELRLGGATHAVKAGDLIASPAGGPEGAHQLVNTSDAELRYLAVSSTLEPEICEYPDSGKVGTYAGDFYLMSYAANPPDYWQGE